MNKRIIPDSELVLRDDGSVYHLNLKPEDISDTIILVGDPGRVDLVASLFDKIELKKHNREFYTITGQYNGKRITAQSTGIGTDNIDIVVNELDALVNIDLKNRVVKDEHSTLTFVRIGTTGSLQPEIPVDSPIAAKVSLGFDNLLNYYADRDKASDKDMEQAFVKFVSWSPLLHRPYFVHADEELFNRVAHDMHYGITIAAPGFYGPQGRYLRLEPMDPHLNEKLQKFQYNGLRITNYEMESSALYGLSKLLGHRALAICNVIANRFRGEFSPDYHAAIKRTIQTVLDRLTA